MQDQDTDVKMPYYEEAPNESNVLQFQSVTSKNTSINGNKLPKVFKLVESRYGWEPDSVNLDLGGGRYDNATEYLAERDVENLIFDPYNRSEDHNDAIMDRIETNQVDTVTLSNVLCVIPERFVQDLILHIAHKSLKPGGILYLTAYEGDKSGKGRNTGKDQWQENRKLADYAEQVNKVFGACEIKYGMIRAIRECA